ncbi:MAG: hypothetical protein R3E53_09200 [Myxococcota bacterium]
MAGEGAESRAGEKPRKLSHAERRELDGIFDAIAATEAEIEGLQTRLADPETYRGEADAVVRLREALAAAEAEQARLTARWEELEARDAASRAAS